MDKIEDEAQKVHQMFFGRTSLVIACLLGISIVYQTTDVRFFSIGEPITIPVINLDMEIQTFYAIWPLILLTIYVHSHGRLQRIWKRLADMPSIFPDGTRLDDYVDSWFIASLIRAHFPLLRLDTAVTSRLYEAASFIVAWSLVPFAILIMWLRYLTVHNWVVTALHLSALIISLHLTFGLYRATADILRQQTVGRAIVAPIIFGGELKHLVVTTLIAIFIVLISFGAISGVPAFVEKYSFQILSLPVSAQLNEADVSLKPPGWWANEDLSLVEGARLRGRDLRSASAVRAFFARADLRDADLRKANMMGADFRQATLSYARIDSSLLVEANLEEAELSWANLSNADLRDGNLRGVRANGTLFRNVNLKNADLSMSKFKGANLVGANFEGANLEGANLEGANLKGTNLQDANFAGANLQGADLRGADLREAKLVSANLQGANLTKAKALTQEQLDEACGDNETTLPDYLADYKMKPCPESAAQSPSN